MICLSGVACEQKEFSKKNSLLKSSISRYKDLEKKVNLLAITKETDHDVVCKLFKSDKSKINNLKESIYGIENSLKEVYDFFEKERSRCVKESYDTAKQNGDESGNFLNYTAKLLSSLLKKEDFLYQETSKCK